MTKNTRKTNKTHRKWLFTALAISSILSTNPNRVEAAIGNQTVPDWLDEPIQMRSSLPNAYRLTKAHPDYNYYRNLTGKDPLILKETYKGITVFTPVPTGRGSTSKYTTLTKPEQVSGNNKSRNYTNPSGWTAQSGYNAASHLIDRNKSPHAKAYTTDVKKGFNQAKVVKSNNIIPSGTFKGQKGEWRHLGYSEVGGVMINSIFPADHLHSSAFTSGGRNYAEYDFLLRPWEKKSTMGYVHVKGGTKFDKAPKNSPDWKIKYDAVKRMIDERPNYRAKSSSVEYWMDRYSLQNDPSGGDSAVFIAANKTGNYKTVSVEAMPRKRRNLTIVSQRVVDEDGNEIRRFARNTGDPFGSTSKQTRKLMPGEKVRVETTLKNTSPSGQGTTTAFTPTIELGYMVGNTGVSEMLKYEAEKMTDSFTLKDTNMLASGQSRTFTQNIVVPYNTETLALFGDVSETHYYAEDNTILSDDFTQMALTVNDESGNLVNRSIRLVDKSGKEVEHPVPGEQYRLRFYVDYESQSRKYHYVPYTNKDGETYYQYEEYDYYSNNINIDVNYRINRQLPHKGSDGKTEVVTKKIGSMRRGTSTSFNLTTDEYITYETGVFDVDTTISVNKGSSRFNKDASDDKLTQQYRYIYDLNIENASLIPKTTVHTADGDSVTYLMKFDVNYIVPNHAKSHAKDVAFAVNVGGQTKTVTEHIKGGHNPNVTIEIDVPLEGKDQVVEGIVLANVDAYVYESNYENNSAKVVGAIKNDEKAKPYVGGINTGNTWDQHVQVYKWNSVPKSYKHFNLNTMYNFPMHTPNGSATNQKITLSEDYKINHVWFRSKTTQDLQAGANKDGWVDLMKEVGKIKAGYGYELKVDVVYKTDAFSKLPKQTSNQWVRPQVANSALTNNLYIQTPDGDVHSADGGQGTTKSLGYDRKQSTDKGKTDWTFNIAPRKVLGVDTLGKFYIGEDVSNGVYNLTVFTPKVDGLLGKMTSEKDIYNNPLFDQQKDLEIEVVGSATDDLTDHINQ